MAGTATAPWLQSQYANTNYTSTFNTALDPNVDTSAFEFINPYTFSSISDNLNINSYLAYNSDNTLTNTLIVNQSQSPTQTLTATITNSSLLTAINTI
ncbi:hypothetical protein FACS1894166_08440 [Bacilli bacterium]|nr:hypothetical protein FACS1894166_08440 [Bacilli bacterium]